MTNGLIMERVSRGKIEEYEFLTCLVRKETLVPGEYRESQEWRINKRDRALLIAQLERLGFREAK